MLPRSSCLIFILTRPFYIPSFEDDLPSVGGRW
jgi:hypothetical protein